jgi:hypothetical protein
VIESSSKEEEDDDDEVKEYDGDEMTLFIKKIQQIHKKKKTF